MSDDAPRPDEAELPEGRPPAPEGALVPKGASREDLERAVVSAAAVLQALAENQRALRESVERAERTDLLLKNVSGLNETFRAVAATQQRLLEAVDESSKQRAAAEGRARRARIWGFVMAAAVLGAAAVALFAVSSALKVRSESHEALAQTVKTALQSERDSARRDREAELERLTLAFRDALADRQSYESKLEAAQRKADEVAQEAKQREEEKSATQSELDTLRRQRDEAMRQIAEYQQRVQDGEAGIQRVLALIEEKQRGQAAAKVTEATAKPESQPAAENPAENLTNLPTAQVSEPAPTAAVAAPTEGGAESAAPSATPSAVPLTKDAILELNGLLAYGAGFSLRLLEAGGRLGSEICDAYFTRYNEKGRPAGFVYAKRMSLLESDADPKLRVQLQDGYEVNGSLRTPFITRALELTAVDPNSWRRRLPELLPGAVADVGRTAPMPADARAAMERLNLLLDRHTSYGRYRVESIASVADGQLLGIRMVSLVQPRGVTVPQVDQTLQARTATLHHRERERRLEIELEDGSRGSQGRLVPFPGGKLRILIPEVDATELVGGDSPLPVRKG
ncbi:MAG: hypothetical protein JNJ88_04120 [Planctomycetes bacterium]|nr:hypothetical protein [Planctomycetota bacterium]